MNFHIGQPEHTKLLTGVLVVAALFLVACDSGRMKAQLHELPSRGDFVGPGSCRSNNSCRCEINGLVLMPGESILTFRSSTVAAGNQCESQTRVCDLDGNLSGSYSFSRCSVNAPSDCTLGNRTVLHGETVSAFENNVVPFGVPCSRQLRTCENGVLSGDSRFQFASCQSSQASSCNFNGQTIAHGNSVLAYQATSVPAGQQCVSQSRTCDNGVLGGTFLAVSCTVQNPPPQNCILDGVPVVHLATVTAYRERSAVAPATCVSEQRTCNDGQFISGSFLYRDCTQTQPPPTGMTIENYPRSGKLYSTMSRMPKAAGDFSGYYFGSQANSQNFFFWWGFRQETSSQQGIATIHWSTPDDYREFYRYEGTWNSLDGWSVNYRDPNGAAITFPDGTSTLPGETILILYKIETTRAELTFQPHSATPSTINITSQFLGRGKPYSLENIPSVQYRLHVEGKIVQYTVYQGIQRRTLVAPRIFAWTVTYDPPGLRNSAFLGNNKMSILQTERWVDDSPQDITQGQTICEGIGYLCRSDRPDGSVVGVTIPLSGPLPPPTN